MLFMLAESNVPNIFQTKMYIIVESKLTSYILIEFIYILCQRYFHNVTDIVHDYRASP